jgi:RNA polymerase subunit RPABC4/transcription elongation factor Spt4
MPLGKSVGMNLREARLCLDCEELHTEEQCPVCASEAFSFLTRWIPPHDFLDDDASRPSRRAAAAARRAARERMTAR